MLVCHRRVPELAPGVFKASFSYGQNAHDAAAKQTMITVTIIIATDHCSYDNNDNFDYFYNCCYYTCILCALCKIFSNSKFNITN